MLFLFHDRQDLLSIVENSSYFDDVNFLVSRARKSRQCSETSGNIQLKAPSFAVLTKYIKLYNKKVLANRLLSIRGAKYVAEVLMQASMMEVNNLIDLPKIYSFGYLHAGGVLLTEYTATVERALYSVQHGYPFNSPDLDTMATLGLIEDGADKTLVWTSSCMSKYRICFSDLDMANRAPAIESLRLDESLEKQQVYNSGRVIMIITPRPDFSHIGEANRFVALCLKVGVRPVVTLHPMERNLKSLFRYVRNLKTNVRYLSLRDSRMFFNERYMLSNGSSLLFFAFMNGSKVGYWTALGGQTIGSTYHFVSDHITTQAEFEKFLVDN